MRTVVTTGVWLVVVGAVAVVATGAVPDPADRATTGSAGIGLEPAETPNASGADNGNRAPTARLDIPGCAFASERFVANGTASTDPDGDDMQYSWEIRRETPGHESTNGTVLNRSTPAPQVVFTDRPTEEFWRLERRTVVLRVTDEHGATDTATANVTIRAGYAGQWLSLDAVPSVRAGERTTLRVDDPLNCDPVSYDWTVSGVATSPVTVQPSVGSNGSTLDLEFEDAGDTRWRTVNATVTLRARDEDGVLEVLRRTVTVENPATVPPNRPPVPRIDAPGTVDRSRYGTRFQVSAANSTDPDGDALRYEWSADFGEGGADLHGNRTVLEFPDDGALGNHTVTLTVTDEHGVSRTTNHTVRVRSAPPTVEGIYVEPVPVGETLPLETGQEAYVSASGEVAPNRVQSTLTTNWSLDGGVVTGGGNLSGSYQEALNVRWDSPGRKTIRLTVTDEHGRSVTVRRTVDVTASGDDTSRPSGTPGANESKNRPPTARLVAPSCVRENEPFVANATGSRDPDGDDLTYRWAFRERSYRARGAIRNRSGARPTVEFTDAPADIGWKRDDRTIELQVTDEHGATDTATANLTVGRFEQWLSLDAPDAVTTGTWRTLAVRDPYGCNVSAAVTVVGVEQSPATVRTRPGSDPSTVEVRFADGPSRVRWRRANVTVRVETFDEGGHFRTLRTNLTVENAATVPGNEPPVARITGPETAVWGERFRLSAANSTDPDGDRLGYRWRVEFETGRVDLTAETPAFTYRGDAVETNHTVTLTVTDPHGATDTVRRNVTVRSARPEVAGIHVTPWPYNESFPVRVGEKAFLSARAPSDPDGSRWNLTYEWSFDGGRFTGPGDELGPTDYGANVVWDSPGEKTVAVTVTDRYGRSVTVRETVTVAPPAGCGPSADPAGTDPGDDRFEDVDRDGYRTVLDALAHYGYRGSDPGSDHGPFDPGGGRDGNC